ncbi:MAG: DUF1127 domain-containing protein [Gammaproteobacteria bacterium]|nr:DUF1127 domain-containing protein [Gammaproteobacteria bacterium]
MKVPLNAIMRRVMRIVVRIGYARARGEFLQLSDKTLDDIGISRALLEQGIDAWPWREENAAVATTNKAPLSVKPAIAKLRRYNDAKLNGLPIAPGQIETVVVKGREGIDTPCGVPVANIPPTEAELERAVAELRRFTDAELRDLGLTRGSIADAVRHGRPGIDVVPPRTA